MSHQYALTGEFAIDVPLSWKVYRDTDLLPGNDDDDMATALMFTEHTETIDTDDGQLCKRVATGLVPRRPTTWGDMPRYEVGRVAALCADHGSQLVGTLYVVGEDGPLDTWRLYTDTEGKLVVDQAILVWPDGRRAYQEVPFASLPGCETYSGMVLTLGDRGPIAWPDPIDPGRILKGKPWQR
jgi:hypothetical protein